MAKFEVIFSKAIHKERFLLCVMSITLSITTLVVESLTQRFIDGVSSESIRWLGTHLSVLLAAYFGVTILGYYKHYYEKQLDQQGRFEGQVSFYKRLLDNRASFLMQKNKGVLLHGLTNDIYEAMPWLAYGKWLFVLEWFNLVLIVAFMVYMNLSLALVVVGLVGLSLALSNRMGFVLGRSNNKKQEVKAGINHFLLDAVSNLRTIVQLDKGPYFSRQFDRQMDDQYRPVVEGVIKAQAFYIAQLIFSQEMLPFMVLVCGLILSAYHMSTIGTTIIMMNLTIQISKSVQAIGDLLPQKHLSNEIVNRLKPLFMETKQAHKAETRDEKAKNEERKDENLRATKTSGEKTRLQHVSQRKIEALRDLKLVIPQYTYLGSDHVVLNHVYFDLEKGDCVQLIGASGKGKTTLIALISQLLTFDGQPSDCNILYNGYAIESYDIRDYYKHVLQVTQSPLIVEGSLLDNLCLGEDYSEALLNEVIETACLSDFVRDNQLAYPIKEKGQNISGGERQRIGLARVLLRKPDLLILDEVTSALNPIMRAKLVEKVMAYQSKYQLTMIVISHNDDFSSYCNKVWDLG